MGWTVRSWHEAEEFTGLNVRSERKADNAFSDIQSFYIEKSFQI